MATPRKVSKAQTQSDSSPARKRWPTEDEAAPSGAARAGGATATSAVDLVAVVRGLAAAVAEHNLAELVVDTPDATFTIRRGAAGVQAMAQMPSMPMQPMQPMSMPIGLPTMPPMGLPTMQVPMMPAPSAAAPAAAPPGHGHGHGHAHAEGAAAEEKGHLVTSPFVGTFYRRPNPDSPEYVRVNDRVKKGQVLCIIEAMKLMNEIEADVVGTLIAVLAEDGAPVEYGQPLFKIAP